MMRRLKGACVVADTDQYNSPKYHSFVAHGFIIISTRQPRRLNEKPLKTELTTKTNNGLGILAIRSGRQDI